MTINTPNSRLFSLLLICFLSCHSYAQVGVGTTSPSEGVMLDIESTNAGILIPRVALTSKATQAPVTTIGALTTGTLIFNTATAGTGSNAVIPGFYYWGGAAWVQISPNAIDAWELEGNVGTTPGTGAGQNYIGTSDTQSLIIATDNTERVRVLSDGRVAINNAGTAGVRLQSTGNAGEFAIQGSSSTTGRGVQGVNTGTGIGVIGFSQSTGIGLYGLNSGSGNSLVTFNSGTGNGINNQTADGNGILNFVGGNSIGLFTDLTDAGGTGEIIDLDVNNGVGVSVRAVDDTATPTAGGDVFGFIAEVRTQTPTVANIVSGAAFTGNQTGIGHGILLNHSGATGRNAEFNITNPSNTNPTIFATQQGEGPVLQIQGQKNNATTTLTVADISYTGTGTRDHIAVNGASNPSVGRGIGVRGSGGLYGVFSQGELGAAGVKTFLIDHPEDPENKFLRHYSIESNEVLNMYRGTDTFDTSGNVTISLPTYYDDVNKNPSYQLTPVGAAMPNLFVSQEIENNKFTISGGVAGKKVSWTITAERNDRYMQSKPHLREAEMRKDGDRKGKYVIPELYNQPEKKGIFYPKSSGKKSEPSQMDTQKIQSLKRPERLQTSKVQPDSQNVNTTETQK